MEKSHHRHCKLIIRLPLPLLQRVRLNGVHDFEELAGIDEQGGMKRICGTKDSGMQPRKRRDYRHGAVYLGAYDEEESAARAYDLAATKYWGTSTITNFPISDYEKEIEIMQHLTREEYLASLRSNGFARGASKYKGVARHHHNGRWEARIGRVFGNKYLYLGTYSTQEEAAHAYDIAAIEYRGINAVTNFDLSTYIRWLTPGYNPTDTESLRRESLQTHPNDINSRVDSEFSFNSSNHFTTSEYSISHKPEIVETKLRIDPSTKPTSPTALGLLLRSSMFKELKQKNPNAGNEEI